MRTISRASKIANKAAILREIILSANDGVITTFAVVAGANGAKLTSTTIILLGLANLIADGISMSSGSYLGTESENEMLQNKSNMTYAPKILAIITFIAFITAGIIPLTPYFFFENSLLRFELSLIFVAITLLGLGFLRGHFSKKHYIITIIETIIVGGLSAIIAYGIGYWGDLLLEGNR